MIVQVTSAAQRAQFEAIAQLHVATKAQMTARLALFGEMPASGWQFYLCDVQGGGATSDAALVLRGNAATLMGQDARAFDPEELESFLAFLGGETLTTTMPCAIDSYALQQQLFVYTLAAGQALAVPPLRGDCFTLDRTPSVSAILPLLWGDDTDAALQENYYADSCVARNAGMAAFWLVRDGETPVFTLAASAVVGQSVYLSAGETIERYRGQGIGGHYIASMANEYAAKGYDVCFVCEAVRCRFYDRLGFTQRGVLHQYVRRAR